MNDKISLSELIRENRMKNKWSLRKLSELMGGVALSHLSDIEMGRRYPTEEQMGKFSEIFGIPLEELLAADPRQPIREVTDFMKREPQYAFAFRKFVQKVKREGLSASQVDKELSGEETKELTRPPEPPHKKDTP